MADLFEGLDAPKKATATRLLQIAVGVLIFVVALAGKQFTDRVSRAPIESDSAEEQVQSAPKKDIPHPSGSGEPSNANITTADPSGNGDSTSPPSDTAGDGENVGTQAPTNQINDYVGTWMGGIQQGFATMPFKFQFNADMTCTVWPADEPVVNTTYEIVEGGKFLVLFNNNNVDEAFQGSASQGETGKFLDFCYHTGISKDSTGRMRSREQMCGTAQKR